MPEHIKYEDDDLFNPETHHESSDVPVGPLLWFIVGFIVFGIVTHLVVLFFYKGLASAERRRMDPPQTQVARPADANVPKNQPLLQPFPRTDTEHRPIPPNRITPVTDLADMRHAEDQALHQYGWVDRAHGVVHIPIEDAKKLYAAKMGSAGGPPAGTPAASPAVLPTAEPAVDQPASGRRSNGGHQ
jgi:hypothetical protein